MRNRVATLSLVCCMSSSLFAQDSVSNRLNLHFQTTYIYQYKPQFNAPYQGVRSIVGEAEKQNSLTATLYLGARLWKGAEIYFNPELAGGSGLSGAQGMGGSSNGETFRVGNPAPTLYTARLYFAQSFSLNKTSQSLNEGANQIAMNRSADYIKIMAGKFSVADIFDVNDYSNSPRTQFLNWSLMNTGAWDFAANVRGYTYVLAGVAQYKSMSYKLAFASLPKTANGDQLETDISKSISVNAEIDKHFRLCKKEGNIRILGFYNNAPMGNYSLATYSPKTSVLDITENRKTGRTKVGFAISGDYQLNQFVGLFGRLGWNDGKNETWCFTEIDQTLALGLSFDGKKWKRTEDKAGIAFVANGLSNEHKTYLQKGGLGFVLGDGTLKYAPESIMEAYYSYKPSKLPLYFSGDYQFCLNPGYNADRGLISIFSFRVHVEL